MINPAIEQFLADKSWLLILIAIWSLPWKGVALWRAAQAKSLPWFVALLVLNTAGLLEIIYIFHFSKNNPKTKHHGDS